MASKTNFNLIESYFGFSIKSESFNDEYLTPEINLSGLPWKIRVAKRAADAKDVIDIFLQCSPVFEANTLNWSCQAQATIKLLSDSTGQAPYEKRISKTEFNKKSQSHGLSPFISWTDMKRYEQNGEVHFDIHLTANPLKSLTSSQIEQKRAKFRFTVENMSKLTNEKKSIEIILRDNVWRVSVQKFDGHLGIFLVDQRNPQNENWTWKTECSFKLLSFSENIQPIARSIEKVFYYAGEDWGYGKFIAWEELMKKSNKYLMGDKAVFVIDLKVEAAKPSWNSVCDQSNPGIGMLECAICLQSVIGKEPTTTKCGHLFCGPCIKRAIEERRKCPLCNVDANLLDLRPVYLST